MAAYGFAGGLAQGFGQGIESGTQIAEARAKNKMLIDERIMAQIETAEKHAYDGIKFATQFVESSPNRTNPEFNNGLSAMRSQIEDTANILSGLGPKGEQAKQRILQNLNMALSTARTKSEQFTSEVDAKMSYVTGGQGAQPQAQPAQPQMAAAQPQPSQAVPQQQAQVQQGQPASPASPASPMTSQAQATPQPQTPVAPQAAAAKPQNDMLGITPRHGYKELANVPIEDIELVMADPNAAQEFAQTYGIDPNVLFAEPEMPGQTLSEQEMRMQAAGMDPYTPERKAMAGEASKAWKERKDKMAAARETLTANHNARRLLDSGMFTGIGADWRLWAAKAKLAMTDDPELQQKVNNTEAYLGNIVTPVASLIKNFGAGTGLSDADREFAYKAVAGDITMNENSLREILRIRSEMSLWLLKNPERAKPLTPEELQSEQKKYGVEW